MIMFAVHGIYDGKKVKITDRLSENKRYKVVVTFIEELPQEETEIRKYVNLHLKLGVLIFGRIR